MAVDDAAWTRFYSCFATSGILGGLLICTCWGGYGAGIATALGGFFIVFMSFFLCCCDRRACLNACTGGCSGCADCNGLKLLFHVRNTMAVIAIFTIFGALSPLISGIVMTVVGATGDDCGGGGECYNIRNLGLCSKCWDPSWNSHPWHRWEWGLSEICWAEHANERAGETRDLYSEYDKFHFSCRVHDEHLKHRDMKRPKTVQECKELCKCMRGDFDEECGSGTHLIFGLIGLLNFLIAVAFVISLWCGCIKAGEILSETGGPVAFGTQITAAPPGMSSAVQVGQVVGQPVGLPASVVVANIATVGGEQNQ